MDSDQTVEPQVALNITDIAEAVKLLDFAAEQGTFKGWHIMRHALAVRDRLDAFVAAAHVQVNNPSATLE